MRLNPLEGQLERLARTLTDQFGTTVVCRGDQAFTDGRRIVLPSLPEPMDEPLERMVVGYLDHEMAHVAFTDFKEVLHFVQKHPGFKGMLNAVEDALIEKRAMRRWPGVRANLDVMFRQIRTRVAATLVTAKPFDRFAIAVYLKLSHHGDMLGVDSEVVGFDDLLAEFPSVRSTRDAAALSSKLLKRWLQRMTSQLAQRTSPPPPPTSTKSPPPAQTAGEPPSAGDEEESNTGTGDYESAPDKKAADPQSDADNREPADAEDGDHDDSADPADSSIIANAEESPNQPGDGSADREEGGEAQAAQTEAGDATDPSAPGSLGSEDGGSLIGEIVAAAIAEAMQAVDANERYRIFTKDYDRIEVVPDADDAAVRALIAAGVDAVRRLRRGLANALRSAEKRWWREDQSRGDLSPRTLHRLCLDRARLCIFRSRAVVQGKSTAVSIALDASGSMSTSKMNVARDAVRVLLEALHDLKIPAEAFTFTTGDAFDADRAAWETQIEPTEIRQRFTRFGNLEIGLIKRFEDTVKLAMRRLPTIAGTGLTPIGEAMEIGARRLIVRRENRKILLILTDGHPCCEGSGMAAFNHAKYVAGQVRNAGIELIGVGIMDTTLCSIVEDTIVVNQIEELPAQLCKLLSRTLKKGLCNVG